MSLKQIAADKPPARIIISNETYRMHTQWERRTKLTQFYLQNPPLRRLVVIHIAGMWCGYEVEQAPVEVPWENIAETFYPVEMK